MTPEIQSLVIFLLTGLVAGWIASLVLGGGGLLRSLVVGVIGALVGGYLLKLAKVTLPLEGWANDLATAVVGALVVIVGGAGHCKVRRPAGHMNLALQAMGVEMGVPERQAESEGGRMMRDDTLRHVIVFARHRHHCRLARELDGGRQRPADLSGLRGSSARSWAAICSRC